MPQVDRVPVASRLRGSGPPQSATGHAALVEDAELYGHNIQVMLARQLGARGIKVTRRTIGDGRHDVSSVVRSLRETRAQAMVYSGIAENRAAALWRGIHTAHPLWKLLGADGVAYRGFTRRLSASSARRTYLTAPPVAPESLPSSGRAFYTRFRARFGVEPDPYAINGYEAMALILDSIDRASNPADRLAVVDALFATKDRMSVLGQYSIDAFGDTTLPTYGSYRVDRRGRLVWDRVISLPPD